MKIQKIYHVLLDLFKESLLEKKERTFWKKKSFDEQKKMKKNFDLIFFFLN